MKAQQPSSLSESTSNKYTRGGFLVRSAQCLGSLSLASALPLSLKANPEKISKVAASDSSDPVFDLREFVRWIEEELEPSVRLEGGAGHYARKPGATEVELYGVSDMACVLHSIRALNPTAKERSEWAAAFQSLQNPDTGWLLEKSRTHRPLHNTAFALAAMELLELKPRYPVKLEPEYDDIRAFFKTINWTTKMYPESHNGAGLASIRFLVPELYSKAWFDEYFTVCDEYFDSRNGMMGLEKPAGGDFDQIGGTFHYGFIYSNFNRQMPYPKERIDAVLRLRQADGFWRSDNRLWLTLDAIHLMTRSLRQVAHRNDEVRACVRSVMEILMQELYAASDRWTALDPRLPVHSVTAAISIAAEAQNFLGAREVITERPLRLVLDRRPFI